MPAVSGRETHEGRRAAGEPAAGMTILVTGAAGYVGSVLSGRLLERGDSVRGLDVLRFGGRSLLGLLSHQDFEFVRGDIRDAAVLERALHGVDAVVHLAAIVGDPACAREPDVARSTNLDGTSALIDAASRAGVQRFVFASTCSNYGKMDASVDYVDEDAPLQPLSLYAETKVAIEEEILRRQDPRFTVLRFATVFGLSPRMRLDLTVNQFAVEMLVQRKLVVFGEQFWRPYVHVWDAADAIAAVLGTDLDVVGGDVFNVGSTEENYRKSDIIELVQQELDEPAEIEHVTVDEDPRDYRVSFDKIRDRLGYRPARTVQDGLREVLWATSNGLLGDLADASYRN